VAGSGNEPLYWIKYREFSDLLSDLLVLYDCEVDNLTIFFLVLVS
jgi:hypothetical protein